MTREVFLKKMESSADLYLIKNVLAHLDTIKFLNVEFSEHPLENIKISINAGLNDIKTPPKQNIPLNEIVGTLFRSILRNAFKTKSEEVLISSIKGTSSYNSVYEEKRELVNQINKQFDFEFSEHSIVANALLASEAFKDRHNFNITNLPKTNLACFYPIGSIDKCLIYVDPYMRFTDQRFIVLKNKPVTIKIHLLGVLTEDINYLGFFETIIKNNFEISITNPEDIYVFNWDLTLL